MKRFVMSAVMAAAAMVSLGAQASRYATSNPNGLDAEQLAPLQVVVDIEFPRDQIRTVGEAVEFVLKRSGYQLQRNDVPNGPAQFAAQSNLLALPLPDVHRSFHGTTLLTVLNALGRPGYELSVDDLNRVVGYDVRKEFIKPFPAANDLGRASK